MSNKILKIGLYGFGCVGQGLYDVLNRTNGIKAEIAQICVKDKEKKRSLPAGYFTFDQSEIINNEEIDVVVELIDDAEAAYYIVTTALKKGKAVVTANKKMLAEHLEELHALQQQYNAPLLYEAAVCASIPVIRNLEEYYDNDLLNALEGIVNGTTNYILTKLQKEGGDYPTALLEAQALGYAESNPSFDIEGTDAKYKTCILVAHAFGLFVEPQQILNYGIKNVLPFDLQFAKEKGYKLKLVAHCSKEEDELLAFVLPTFVEEENLLHRVEDVYNGVVVEAVFSDRQFFLGRGAGGHPTGSAVLSDISALTYNYKYEYKKLKQGSTLKVGNSTSVKLYIRGKNIGNLEKLPFENIEQSFTSKEFSYIIGNIQLHYLSYLGLIKDPSLFIARVGIANSLRAAVKETEVADIQN